MTQCVLDHVLEVHIVVLNSIRRRLRRALLFLTDDSVKGPGTPI